MSRSCALLKMLIVFLLVIGCARAVPTVPLPSPPPPPPTPTPGPIAFPVDEAPHDDLLEWWYYNGHLQDEQGREYGFHFVVFQAARQGIPPVYTAHASLTDVERDAHSYEVRFTAGEQLQPDSGFSLRVGEWNVGGALGQDRIHVEMEEGTLDLVLRATKPVVLHNRIGWLGGPTGWTYYYSWTRMEATGALVTGGQSFPVRGTAWMDHQWGDFVVLAAPGGWQWFAVQLDDGTEVMVTESRDPQGEVSALYGTYVDAQGSARPLSAGELSLEVLGRWESPHTGAVYPGAWRLRLSQQGLDLRLTPIVADQEMAKVQPVASAYWEGKVKVAGTRNGVPVTGQAYVELVGYVEAPLRS
ncbi:MAG: hypothetical protein HY685_00935 [Chloroflexi bacterium]|nr:hypothetical protein [Chloroflexota bacterium]